LSTTADNEMVRFLRYAEHEVTPVEGALVREAPLTIFVNGQELVTLLCTPSKLNCLVVGFLYLEGILQGVDEISLLRLCDEEQTAEVRLSGEFHLSDRPRVLTSGCGGGTTFTIPGSIPGVDSALRMGPEQLAMLMKSLLTQAGAYKETGGIHTSALGDGRKLDIIAEDVGRHNTIDKIVGECLLSGISCKDRVLLTTGRISSEMLMKAARVGVPIVASRSSPTDLAVRLADELNVTIVGYLRGGKMNIYTHAWRIVIAA
jgi:FdhD protein